MGNTLIAYQKWEDMAEYILKCVVTQPPKSERYALGEQMRNLTVGIGVHIARAVAIRHVGMRKREVEEADCDLCALKVLIRLADRLRYIDKQKFGQCALYTTELGKIIGGWTKSLSTQGQRL